MSFDQLSNEFFVGESQNEAVEGSDEVECKSIRSESPRDKTKRKNKKSKRESSSEIKNNFSAKCKPGRRVASTSFGTSKDRCIVESSTESEYAKLSKSSVLRNESSSIVLTKSASSSNLQEEYHLRETNSNRIAKSSNKSSYSGDLETDAYQAYLLREFKNERKHFQKEINKLKKVIQQKDEKIALLEAKVEYSILLN